MNPTTAPDIAETFPLDLEQLRKSQNRLRDRFTSHTVTELPEAYAKRLNAAREAAEVMNLPEVPASELNTTQIVETHNARTRQKPKTVPINITYTTAAELFYLYLKGWLQREGKTPQDLYMGPIDPKNPNSPTYRSIVQNIIRWAIKSEDCEYDLNKGLYLYGGIGTGKTMLIHALQYICEAARLSTQFNIVQTTTISDTIKKIAYSNEKKAQRLTADLDSLEHGNWCFDDLGEDNEPISVKLWGTDEPIMSPKLSKRYDLFQHMGLITHVTSNIQLTSLDPDETTIETRYGSRIKDRMKIMFNFILLDGDSRRR